MKVARRIGLKEVELRVNKKKSVIYQRMTNGMFPERNQDGWLEEDIEYYVLHGSVRPKAPAANGEFQAAE